RLADEAGGLLLQVVPTLNTVSDTSGYYSDYANVFLTGSGFVEGAQQVLFGGTAVPDVWDYAGPDSFYDYSHGYRPNAAANFGVPANAPPGPIPVRTLGGTSAPFAVSFTGTDTDAVA